MLRRMEQLISEIEAYARQRNIKPATVLQYAAGLGGGAWDRWRKGATCTFATAERVRKFMADNPPVKSGSGLLGSGSLACPDKIVDGRNDCKGAG